MNSLYFGDNLDILRAHLGDATVDLIYLDPPFNSHASYNVLFKTPKGHASDAQITAFDDTWHWGEQAQREFEELLHQPNTAIAKLMAALRSFLGDNDLMAYLTLMANRLLELHRVLKPTGSLYLHCDPTASHYLKIVLDGVFGKEYFRNEIVWKRTNAHNDSKTWARITDTIFYFTKSSVFTWNTPREAHSNEYLGDKYRYDDGDGRGSYRLGDMTSPSPRPKMTYEWLGFPSPEKGWRYQRETMQQLHDQGRIWYPRRADGDYDHAKRPQLKRYLREMAGAVMSNIWTDIPPLNSQAAERLGYPTQKPLALLERILQASSNPGDVVLDPFCGCGTAVHAAQALGRPWLGIDITHLAITLIEKRLKAAFPGLAFTVQGTPQDLDGARDLAARDKYQFQWWACSLVNAQPYQGKKKGADTGIDGLIFFHDDQGPARKIVVSVKGGATVTVAMIRDLAHVIDREGAALGLFVTLAAPTSAMQAAAAAVGFYASPSFPDRAYPKLQLLSIAGLLTGTEQARYPDLSGGTTTFKQAQPHVAAPRQERLF